MILFNSAMQREKVAVIGLVIIIVVALFAYLAATYDIFGNLFENEEESGVIEIGDCVEVNYIGKYTNGTIFDSSYEDPLSKTGGEPAKFFVSLDPTASPPDDYYDYAVGIEGFTEGLIGMKEGEEKTIGPIPPEKAYGIAPSIGDTIEIHDASIGGNLSLEIVDIQINVSLPDEFAGWGFADPTNLYILRDNSHYIGEKMTFYPSWENASVVTKINDTLAWVLTTPPEDKIENFTWTEIDLSTGELVSYWENSSSAEFNESTIVVTHTPAINDTMEYISDYETIVYTVVNLTEDKINVSYLDSDGNISYYSMDRKITIERNQTQDIVLSFPTEYFEYLLSYLQMLDPTIDYSLSNLAGKTLIFDVEIVKIHKTSQES
jgi:FKBP-type peptidyl-prolyl cis-trans isomerase 2